jgi:membrane protease YdiL (CAAX protease family)
VRIPRSLAWALLAATFLTAGMLRQFHEHTPASPYAPPAVGSLLFAAVVFVLLIWAWESRRGPSPGPGIRLGSLAPLLAMLLVEKWISIFLYQPVFDRLFSSETAPAVLVDAWYRAFAGGGLLLSCVLLWPFSLPASRRVASTLAPRRLVEALAATGFAVGATYATLGVLPWLLGEPFAWRGPRLDTLGLWVASGQTLRAFAEELYYRGLLLQECGRLAPRLGARSAPARRWAALVPPSLMFGLEHLVLAPDGGQALERFVFSASLGLLFGLMMLASRSLWLPALVHAWINVLLLGAAPVWLDASGRPAPASGTYVAIALAFTFVAVYFVRRREDARTA